MQNNYPKIFSGSRSTASNRDYRCASNYNAWRGKLVSSNNATYGHDALRPGIVVGPIGLSAGLFPDRSFMVVV